MVTKTLRYFIADIGDVGASEARSQSSQTLYCMTKLSQLVALLMNYSDS